MVNTQQGAIDLVVGIVITLVVLATAGYAIVRNVSPGQTVNKPLLEVVSSETVGWEEDPSWQAILYNPPDSCRGVEVVLDQVDLKVFQQYLQQNPQIRPHEIPEDQRYQIIEAELGGRRLTFKLVAQRTQDPNFSRELCTRDRTTCHRGNQNRPT